MTNQPTKKQYTQQKKIIRRWWTAFSLVLIATLVAEFFMEPHPHFSIDGTPFFYAWFGFSACFGIVMISKALALVLKRSDDYYLTQEDQA